MYNSQELAKINKLAYLIPPDRTAENRSLVNFLSVPVSVKVKNGQDYKQTKQNGSKTIWKREKKKKRKKAQEPITRDKIPPFNNPVSYDSSQSSD